MNLSIVFMRTLFAVLSIFFMTLFMISNPTGSIAVNAAIGVFIGLAFGLLFQECFGLELGYFFYRLV